MSDCGKVWDDGHRLCLSDGCHDVGSAGRGLRDCHGKQSGLALILCLMYNQQYHKNHMVKVGKREKKKAKRGKGRKKEDRQK